MTNKENKQVTREYTRPKLTIYGSVSAKTASGSTVGKEGYDENGYLQKQPRA
jgi:hypothetical protein